MQDVVQGLPQVYVHVPRIGPCYVMRITRDISLQLVVCHSKENLEIQSVSRVQDQRIHSEYKLPR